MYLGKPFPDGLSDERLARQDEILRSIDGGSFRVLIAGATHVSFSDEPFWVPLRGAAPARTLAVVRAYLLEFFRAQLLHTRTELLDGPSANYPEASVKSFSPTAR
jgi:hypothetical protein